MTNLRRPDAVLSAELVAQAKGAGFQPSITNDIWRAPRPEGWTLDEMTMVARIGSSRIRFLASGLVRDSVDIAWEGVAIAVATDPHTSWQDAAAAAADAVAKEASSLQQHYQLSSSSAHTGARFATFWVDWLNAQARPPEHCIEHIAFRQVWDALTDADQHILMLATVMTSTDIAEHLGLSAAAASLRLSSARRRAIALWHDWEKPPTHLPRARLSPPRREHCSLGHPLEPRRPRGARMKWLCKVCDAASHRVNETSGAR